MNLCVWDWALKWWRKRENITQKKELRQCLLMHNERKALNKEPESKMKSVYQNKHTQNDQKFKILSASLPLCLFASPPLRLSASLATSTKRGWERHQTLFLPLGEWNRGRPMRQLFFSCVCCCRCRRVNDQAKPEAGLVCPDRLSLGIVTQDPPLSLLTL